MKLSEPLQLVSAGSLNRPGPIGRTLRFALGVFCLYVLAQIVVYWEWTTLHPIKTLDNRLIALLVPLCLFNYVVNIGFSRNWGQRPLFFTLFTLLASSGIAYGVHGTLDSPILGLPLNILLAYFYGHLGISFVTAALIATPGCEMRALPELIGRASGKESAEHHCPAGFITQIDEWEQRRMSK